MADKKVTIECKNIDKSFSAGSRRIKVLHGVSISMYEKEIVILMGPSGSGKTTLVSIIGGLLDQDAGDCLISGKDINKLPPQEKTVFRGKNIGFLFQNSVIVPTLNSVENAVIPLLCNGYPRKESFEKATGILKEIGLKDQLKSTQEELSGGEKQRVAIARAIILNPPIIICDEPTSALDFERGKQIMKILQNIRDEKGSTIIIVTHDQRLIQFADRMVTLEDGKIKEDNSNNHVEKA
jgi:putative ABC transport system ATP-binding protein